MSVTLNSLYSATKTLKEKGKTQEQIAAALNEMGYKTKRGAKFTQTKVSTMLRDLKTNSPKIKANTRHPEYAKAIQETAKLKVLKHESDKAVSLQELQYLQKEVLILKERMGKLANINEQRHSLNIKLEQDLKTQNDKIENLNKTLATAYVIIGKQVVKENS